MTPISADIFPQLRLFAPRRTPSTPSALKATSEQKPLAENKVRNQVQIRKTIEKQFPKDKLENRRQRGGSEDFRRRAWLA